MYIKHFTVQRSALIFKNYIRQLTSFSQKALVKTPLKTDHSHFRVEAHCNVRKTTAALCLVRSQPYSHFRVEAYCNVIIVTATLCLVVSTLYLTSGWKLTAT